MIDTCPCGLMNTYLDCCGAYIEGIKSPLTPEALMRSRYTAYTLQKMDYIERTMCGKASEYFNKKNAYDWAKEAKWLYLKVISAEVEGRSGWVEYIANFMFNNKKQTIHEMSEFSCIDGCWYYVDGKHLK